MTEQENHRSIEVHCPACQAKPGDQCTAETDTGRKDVTWFHFARLDRSWWLFGAARLVKDKHGDIWQHNATTGVWDSYETASFPIEHIEKKWGPVQNLTPDELTAYVQTKELRERREEARKHRPEPVDLQGYYNPDTGESELPPQLDSMPVSALKKNSEPHTVHQVPDGMGFHWVCRNPECSWTLMAPIHDKERVQKFHDAEIMPPLVLAKSDLTPQEIQDLAYRQSQYMAIPDDKLVIQILPAADDLQTIQVLKTLAWQMRAFLGNRAVQYDSTLKRLTQPAADLITDWQEAVQQLLEDRLKPDPQVVEHIELMKNFSRAGTRVRDFLHKKSLDPQFGPVEDIEAIDGYVRDIDGLVTIFDAMLNVPAAVIPQDGTLKHHYDWGAAYEGVKDTYMALDEQQARLWVAGRKAKLQRRDVFMGEWKDVR